jgi:hypothetical protein
MKTTKNMMEETIKQYKADLEIANKDLSGWDRRTYNAQVIGKRQAEDSSKAMKNAYNQALLQSAAVYLVYGGKQKDYNKLSNVFQDLGYTTFLESTMSMYERLYPRVEENVDKRKREYNNHCLLTLASELAILGKEMGLDSFLEPKIDFIFGVPTAADTLKAVRSSIMANNGYSLMIEYITQSFLKKAMDTNHATDITPLIVKCVDEKEAKELSGIIFNAMAIINLDEVELNTEFEKTIKKALIKRTTK